tara:strand:+ start:3511 stop:3957 length:447 start_codon:yes stop_codon:yes gene_type:complete
MTKADGYHFLNSFHVFRSLVFWFITVSTLFAFIRLKNPLDKRLLYKIIIAINLLYCLIVDYQFDKFKEGNEMSFFQWIIHQPRDYEYNKDENDPEYLYLSAMHSRILYFTVIIGVFYTLRTNMSAIMHLLGEIYPANISRRYRYLKLE